MIKQNEYTQRISTITITIYNIKQTEFEFINKNSIKQKHKRQYSKKYKLTSIKNTNNQIKISIVMINNQSIQYQLTNKRITTRVLSKSQRNNIQPKSQLNQSDNYNISKITSQTNNNNIVFRTSLNKITSTVQMSTKNNNDLHQNILDTKTKYEHKYSNKYYIKNPQLHYPFPSGVISNQKYTLRMTRLNLRNNTSRTTQNSDKYQNKYTILHNTHSNTNKTEINNNIRNTSNKNKSGYTKTPSQINNSNYNKKNSKKFINNSKYHQKSYRLDKQRKYKYHNMELSQEYQDPINIFNNHHNFKQTNQKFHKIPHTIIILKISLILETNNLKNQHFSKLPKHNTI
jgi:hypothetical protein